MVVPVVVVVVVAVLAVVVAAFVRAPFVRAVARVVLALHVPFHVRERDPVQVPGLPVLGFVVVPAMLAVPSIVAMVRVVLRAVLALVVVRVWVVPLCDVPAVFVSDRIDRDVAVARLVAAAGLQEGWVTPYPVRRCFAAPIPFFILMIRVHKVAPATAAAEFVASVASIS